MQFQTSTLLIAREGAKETTYQIVKGIAGRTEDNIVKKFK